MARLAKADIERILLSGASLSWKGAKDKDETLALGNAKQRRLFAFLLSSQTRVPVGLSEEFTEGLSSAIAATHDPATAIAAIPTVESKGPWRLKSLETDGFGGLNTWGGPTFALSFDGESLLAEGPNGSGKSSLVGAIIWALSGERPRDQTASPPHQPKPVFAANEKAAGEWPPIACYPPTIADIKLPPRVRVQLTFINELGHNATVERILDGGKVTSNFDPQLNVSAILLDAGLLMPARLTGLRLDEGRGRLTDAVQKLTGLDDLIAISTLADGLCHKSREYLSFRRKELATSKSEFDQAIGETRSILATVSVDVPEFVPSNTDDNQGSMAVLGKTLSERATELTAVIANDLATGLNLASPAVQHEVISAIGAANAELELGLGGFSGWKIIDSIGQAFTDEIVERVLNAIASAKLKGDEAVAILERSSKDTRFQLKALASLWHSKHMAGAIDNCPLCENDIKVRPTLVQELEALRSAGDAAARTFDDNLNNILAELDSVLPASVKRFDSEILKFYPRDKIMNEMRAAFVTNDRYRKILSTFGALVEAALPNLPGTEIMNVATAKDESVLKRLNDRIAIVDRLLALANWFSLNEHLCSSWWQNLVSVVEVDVGQTEAELGAGGSGGKPAENLAAHLNRLSDALEKAEPYRRAAKLMRKAWKAGVIASEIEKEINKRESVAESLAPLKTLAPYAEAMARETIEGLSDRISNHLKNTLLTDQFRFSATRLDRKEGLIVRGTFEGDFLIDATLVANTSWLRAVLWAFIFALRSEAIEQIGSDSFPLMVFDDPQSTFDGAHRHRWAQHIALLQNDPVKVQVILTTHDEMFLELIKVSGVSGRHAMIASASTELGFVGIFEGESLERKWVETKAANTDPAGSDYISKVRKYLEGLLRLMLRGQDANVLSPVSGFVVGQSRDKIRHLHTQGITPWNRSEFKLLIDRLDKNQASIKHMEMSHHASGAQLGIAEATDVEAYWRTKLAPTLDSAFRLAREYHHLHGGLTALRAPNPIVGLPEGYQSKLRSIPLMVLGRAAAMSNGRSADGVVDMNEFALENQKKIVLAQHMAFRLTASTLEPVARAGDVLLVKMEGEPEPRSLVVAICDDRIMARRFELADNHSDVAVLTAQSINPNQIAPPFIAQKATLKLYKIIGVLYDNSVGALPSEANGEIVKCNGEADVTRLTSDALGLVEVEGDSAEPIALNGQYLITKKEIFVSDALTTMAGRPVIAADTDQNYYFKRLRSPDAKQVILESLDSGGFHDPVLLASPGNGTNCLARVWPVAGILFELPG